MAVTSIANKLKSGSLLVGNSYYIPPSFESIATVTGTGSSGTITFSSIPQGYASLQIRCLSNDGFGSNVIIRFNGDTAANYAHHQLVGLGSSIDAAGYINRTSIRGMTSCGVSNTMGVGIIDILNYASTTKNKTTRTLAGYDTNTADGRVSLLSGVWFSTDSITQITLNTESGNFSTSSTFALYGIK